MSKQYTCVPIVDFTTAVSNIKVCSIATKPTISLPSTCKSASLSRGEKTTSDSVTNNKAFFDTQKLFEKSNESLSSNTSFWNNSSSLKNLPQNQSMDELQYTSRSTIGQGYSTGGSGSGNGSYTKHNNHQMLMESPLHSNSIKHENPKIKEDNREHMPGKEYFMILEKRLMEIEERLMMNEKAIEANDKVIEVNDDDMMSRVNRQTGRVMGFTYQGGEIMIEEILLRLDALENKIKVIEDTMAFNNVDLISRMNNITEKVECYLTKFTENAECIVSKLDTLEVSSQKFKNDFLVEFEDRLNVIKDDFKCKFQKVYGLIEEQGKLSIESLDMMIEEKCNMMRLEDDFIKILSIVNSVNHMSYEYKGLINEVNGLKNKQKQMMNWLKMPNYTQ